jgi:predicted permease
VASHQLCACHFSVKFIYMNQYLNIVFSSFKAVFNFWLLLFIGVLTFTYPKGNPVLTKGSLKVISHILFHICIPFFVFDKFSKGLKLQTLKESWVLPFWCVLNVFLKFVVSKILGRCLKLNTNRHRRSFYTCASIHNFTAMPIVIMDPLCSNSQLATEGKQICIEKSGNGIP